MFSSPDEIKFSTSGCPLGSGATRLSARSRRRRLRPSGNAPSRTFSRCRYAALLRGDLPSARGKRLPPITADAIARRGAQIALRSGSLRSRLPLAHPRSRRRPRLHQPLQPKTKKERKPTMSQRKHSPKPICASSPARRTGIATASTATSSSPTARNMLPTRRRLLAARRNRAHPALRQARRRRRVSGVDAEGPSRPTRPRSPARTATATSCSARRSHSPTFRLTKSRSGSPTTRFFCRANTELNRGRARARPLSFPLHPTARCVVAGWIIRGAFELLSVTHQRCSTVKARQHRNRLRMRCLLRRGGRAVHNPAGLPGDDRDEVRLRPFGVVIGADLKPAPGDDACGRRLTLQTFVSAGNPVSRISRSR